MSAARGPLKAALSLYVAVAAHLLLLLLLALGGGLQLPQGTGLGLGSGGGDTTESAVADARRDRESDIIKLDDDASASPAVPTIVAQESDSASLAARPIVMTSPRMSATTPSQSSSRAASVAGDGVSATSASAGGGSGGYLADLRRHLHRHRRSLPGVLDSAVAVVSFQVDARGQVSELRLQKSSGIPALDQESVELIRRAAPLPMPPQGQSRRLQVPVSVEAPPG